MTRRLVATVGVTFALAVTLAFLLPHWGVLTPDTKPELYLNADRMLARELSAWRPVPALGSPNYHPGIAPITAVVWAMTELGVAPWLAQRLLAIALTLVGAAGAWRLVRELTGRAGLVPAVAGIAYAVHPYAVVAGATLPIRLPHAVLPWFVLAGVRALTHGGWRRVAVVGLAWFAMGGINGGIVNLFLSLSLPVAAVVVARTTDVPGRVVWRRALAVTGVCVVVSTYWLVPTLLAAGSTGTDIAATTEAPQAVATTSSPFESLRGLGMWTLYLVVGGSPEVPGHVAYLTTGWLVLATLALPVVAALGAVLGTSRARLLAAGLLVVALPIMVGLHPPDRSSPLGRGLAWAFEHVPGAIGFRTTNKIGSLLALGIAVLVGLAAAGRWRGRSLAPLVLGVVALGAWPLWAGNAQPVRLDVPDYWHQAAAELDTEEEGRLLFAPGGFLARYDWGYAGVDDLDTALFDQREVVWRPSVPAGSRPAHNLLTAFDVGMNTGSLGPEAIRTYLSLLGVTDVLVRADSTNLLDGAATSAGLLAAYGGMDGAEVAGTWGPDRVQQPPLRPATPPVAALTQVAVPGSPAPTQLTPVQDNLVLAGDAFAIGDLADAGYAPSTRTLTFLDELSDEQLVELLAVGGRVVLTDTNQRRRWDVRGLDRSHSALLPPEQPLAAAETRVRTTAPGTQTTATASPAATVTSSDDAPVLLRLPASTPPAFAVDGDPSTSWLTGAFGTETGSWIRVDHGVELPLDTIEIQVDTSQARVPTRLRVQAEHEDVAVEVPRDGRVPIGLLSTSSWLRVDVLAARGEGPGPVGITDISVAGRSLRPGMQLPTTLATRVEAEPVRYAVAAAPLDVVLTRVQGDPTTAQDDEERGLRREFVLPDRRELLVRARVRPTAAPEHLVDEHAHRPTDARITSSGPTELGVLGRATQAFDGDASTAWRPQGSSGRLTMQLPRPRRVERLTVSRPAAAAPAVLRVEVGDRSHEFPLVGPRTHVSLPRPARADEVTLTVVAAGLAGQVAPMTEIGLDGVRTATIELETRLAGCTGLGAVDGWTIWVAVDATVGQLVGGQPMPVAGCAPVALAAGVHTYDAGPGWPVDQLFLRSDDPGAIVAAGAPRPGTAVVHSRSATSRRLTATVDEPAVLSTGIAWDPRWRASSNGRDLGPPLLVAGYAVGWRLPPGDHDLVVTYAPQGPVTAGFLVSGAAVVGLAGLAVGARRRRRP